MEYIAWIKPAYREADIYSSVARGTLESVRARAEAIIASRDWQGLYPGSSVIRITCGARQRVVEVITYNPRDVVLP